MSLSRPVMRWGLVVAWVGVIFTFSSERFGGAHTRSLLLPLLEWLLPGTSADALWAVHAAIRKAAHVGEYLVLAMLAVRALRLTCPGTLATAGLAVGICVAVAALDETRQLFVPGRTGAVGDVAIDAAGATAGALLAMAGARLRRAVKPLQTA